MDKQELAKRLMATFLEELYEHTGSLSDHLLSLEKDLDGRQRGEALKSIFRSAHTLKGAARSVSVGPVERVCHRMEDVLAAMRDGQLTLTPDIVSLFLEATDTIEEAGMRLREDQSLADSPIVSFSAKLDETIRALLASEVSVGETTTAATEPPAGSEQPVELAASVVQSGEAQLSDAAAAPHVEKPVAQRVVAGGSRATATIRVASEKLDSLLSQSGELLVARRRVEMRGVDAEDLRDWVTAWRAEWGGAEKPLLKFFAGEESDRPRDRTAELPRRIASVFEQTGERLRHLEKELDQLAGGVVSDGRVLRAACDALDDEVYNVRMLPFAEACGGLQRAVRDLARSAGKDVELVLQGADVEVDRSVLEGLKDLLLHLVRNAVDHGIEVPRQRQAAGKPARAKVTVSAALRGDRVEVVVADDGRGFDVERLRAKLSAKGIPVSDDDREVARLAFLPGISTAAMVTDVSGRGVGLDVVQDRIESLHGSVDVSFRAGAGTSFTMTVPLTLTTIRCVLVTTGGQTYAIPTTSVGHFVRFHAADVRTVAGRDVLLRETPIPIASLAETLGLPATAPERTGDRRFAVILRYGDQQVAFLVDEFLAEQELLVKSLGARIRRTQHVTGATFLPTGRIAMVLNAASIIRTALRQTPRRPVVDVDRQAPRRRKQLLVVEDSLTTRTLMKSILEAAGYEIILAVDGEQAWQQLVAQPVDLVITDVDMPRLDGFDLTTAIRGSQQMAELPVVLVTSRGSDTDKRRGIQVGANAYLVKSGFDQENLLDTIEQLL
jgi:two-component system chemotaxis sensor kinase CheA